MLEHYVIVRLQSIVNRLNNVLEQNLFSEYKKQGIRTTSQKKAINKLLTLAPLISALSQARAAKEYLANAKKHEHASYRLKQYLHAATIVYHIVCELGACDSTRVFCGVQISRDLNAVLKQAIENNPLWEGARKVYQFINHYSPVYSWGYMDYTDNNGNKTFELVKSENAFIELLNGNYTEITASDLGGIRIAYRRELVRVVLPHEKTAHENEFKKVIGSETYDKYYKTCTEILYPSTLYEATYKIYVPMK